MSGSFDDTLFSPEGGFAVRIRDLSGGNGSEPVETIRGFPTLVQANAFARRYVRDSIERCRAPGMSVEEVLAAWFAFGEDAEVVGKDSAAWNSGAEIRDFAAKRVTDSEERNWRVLDPRKHEDDAEGGDEE
ncbi:hypothetical protein MHZ93_07945 [Roseomonas sp. ACRSG]|nr:hypothetical protein [Roseomonas sp. ACRSG]